MIRKCAPKNWTSSSRTECSGLKRSFGKFQLVEPDTLKSKEAFMKHECKIKVLETKVFLELQEKYLADPK